MTHTIYAEDAVEVDGKPVNSCDLKGTKPAWIPREAWVLAHKFADLGGEDVRYRSAGKMWRVKKEGIKSGRINYVDAKDFDSQPRFSRGCTRALSRD